MSTDITTTKPKKKNLGGRPVGKSKGKENKIKQENLKVRLSTLFKVRAISEMTGQKMTLLVDKLITDEYLKVCKGQGTKPEDFPDTLAELEKYKASKGRV